MAHTTRFTKAGSARLYAEASGVRAPTYAGTADTSPETAAGRPQTPEPTTGSCRATAVACSAISTEEVGRFSEVSGARADATGKTTGRRIAATAAPEAGRSTVATAETGGGRAAETTATRAEKPSVLARAAPAQVSKL